MIYITQIITPGYSKKKKKKKKLWSYAKHIQTIGSKDRKSYSQCLVKEYTCATNELYFLVIRRKSHNEIQVDIVSV
jgi:hypothetical protein